MSSMTFLACPQLAYWGMIALAFSIPLSTALDNFVLALLLVLGLAGASRSIWHVAMNNPVVRAALFLFAALVLGMAYGESSLKDAFDALGKYADLAFMPLLAVAGSQAVIQRRVMSVFIVTMLVTALLSWLVGLGILPVAGWMWGASEPDNPAIFRSSITQNVLMVYAVYLLALQIRNSPGLRVKWLYILAAMVMGGSVLFMVRGKTGYVLLLALLVYFSWTTAGRYLGGRGHDVGWKEGVGLVMAGLALVVGVYQASPRLHQEVNQAATEFHAWQPGEDVGSTGERLGFYYNSWLLIKQQPLLGVGTGGFAAAYAQQVPGSNVPNPHNEYLLITAQIGVVGLILLLCLFYTQWQYASALPSTFEQDAARGLVITIALTALFNSPLHDHTEGLFFALASALLFSGLRLDKHNV